MKTSTKRIQIAQACPKCGEENKTYTFVYSTGRPRKWCADCCQIAGKTKSKSVAALNRLGVGPRSGNDYQSRQSALNYIGFADYKSYLASDLWRGIRRKVYKIKGSNCYLCGAPAQALHHNRYHKNDLLGRKLRFINPICHPCHKEIEFQGEDGKKSTVRQAKRAFIKKRKQR